MEFDCGFVLCGEDGTIMAGTQWPLQSLAVTQLKGVYPESKHVIK